MKEYIMNSGELKDQTDLSNKNTKREEEKGPKTSSIISI